MVNIIICNDDFYSLNLYKIYLEKAGFDVVIFDNATPLKNGDYKVPDMFILDRMLNDTDGLDVCRFIKQQPATSNVPVLIFSGEADIHEKAKAAGAQGALRKPFTRQELVYTVHSLLKDK